VHEAIEPEQAGRAAECRRDGGHKQESDTEWIKRASDAAEETGSEVRQAPDDVVFAANGDEGVDCDGDYGHADDVGFAVARRHEGVVGHERHISVSSSWSNLSTPSHNHIVA